MASDDLVKQGSNYFNDQRVIGVTLENGLLLSQVEDVNEAQYWLELLAAADGNLRVTCDCHAEQTICVQAVDGSKRVLPNHEAICKEFGTIAWSNGKNSEIQGERPYALASVLYDVLNRVALDATLGKASQVGWARFLCPRDLKAWQTMFRYRAA